MQPADHRPNLRRANSGPVHTVVGAPYLRPPPSRQGDLHARRLRATLVGALVLVVTAPTSGTRAQDASIYAHLIEALNKLFGVHPGVRANHAKGAVVDSHFGRVGLAEPALFHQVPTKAF